MRYLRILAVLAVLGVFLIPAAPTQAQGFSVGIGVGPVAVGVGPAYVGPAPVCAYGYYPFAPYACAPYGYYNPDYFCKRYLTCMPDHGSAASWPSGCCGPSRILGPHRIRRSAWPHGSWSDCCTARTGR